MIGSRTSLVRCQGEFYFPIHQYPTNLSDSVPARHFVAASYDGYVRIFDYSQNAVFASSIHDAPVTSLSVGPTSISEDRNLMIATASHDLTGRLVRVSLEPDTGERTSSILASLHLHTSPLSDIAYSRSGEHLLTASWDTLIGVWDSGIPEEDEIDVAEVQTDRRKRRKVGGRDRELRPKRKTPSAVLKSHTARVSKAAFSSTGKSAFSCGFDSTVRSWDVENGVCTNTIVRLSLFPRDPKFPLSSFFSLSPRKLIILLCPLFHLDCIRETNGRYGGSTGRQCGIVLCRPQRFCLRLPSRPSKSVFGHSLVYAFFTAIISGALSDVGLSDCHGFVRWSSQALGSQEHQERCRELQSVGWGKEGSSHRYHTWLGIWYCGGWG